MENARIKKAWIGANPFLVAHGPTLMSYELIKLQSDNKRIVGSNLKKKNLERNGIAGTQTWVPQATRERIFQSD